MNFAASASLNDHHQYERSFGSAGCVNFTDSAGVALDLTEEIR